MLITNIITDCFRLFPCLLSGIYVLRYLIQVANRTCTDNVIYMGSKWQTQWQNNIDDNDNGYSDDHDCDNLFPSIGLSLLQTHMKFPRNVCVLFCIVSVIFCNPKQDTLAWCSWWYSATQYCFHKDWSWKKKLLAVVISAKQSHISLQNCQRIYYTFLNFSVNL